MSEWIFAFDRDRTVSSSEGPIPVETVVYLSKHRRCKVWAIGNQALKQEAGIPGIEELASALKIDYKTVKAVGPKELDSEQRNIVGKLSRLGFLRRLYPKATRFIVVDDFNLGSAVGWKHFYPEEFLSEWPAMKSVLN